MKQHPSGSRGIPHSSGFTLLEILVVIGIIGLLIGVLAVAFGVVGNSATKKSTQVTLESLMGMQAEYEASTSLPLFLKTSTVTAGAADQYRCTAAVMAEFRRIPNNKNALEKIPANLVVKVSSPWASATTYFASDVVEYPTNSSAYFKSKVDSNTNHTPAGGAGDLYWTSIPSPVIVPLDGWGQPILYVPAGLTQVGVDPAENGKFKGWYGTAADSGYASLAAGATILGGAVVSPAGRPYWVSAGPDGNFSSHDDNVYSFQN